MAKTEKKLEQIAQALGEVLLLGIFKDKLDKPCSETTYSLAADSKLDDLSWSFPASLFCSFCLFACLLVCLLI